MADYSKAIKDILKSSKSLHGAHGKLRRQIDRIPIEKAAKEITAASKKLDWQALGFGLMPSIRPRLSEEPAFFDSMLTMLAKKEGTTAFQETLLDSMDGVARRGPKKRRNSYFQVLREISASSSRPDSVRRQAIRKLQRDTSPETLELVGGLLQSPNPGIFNAAAYVISVWQKHRVRASDGLAAKVVALANASPGTILASVGALRVLATAKRTGAALARVSRAAGDAGSRDRLLANAGSALSEPQLRRHMKSLRFEPTETGNAALAEVVRQRPSLVKGFFDKRRYEDYVHTVTLVPELEDTSKGTMRLGRAFYEKRANDTAKRLGFRPRVFIPILPPHHIPEYFPVKCSATGMEYATKLQMGDAIYRGLAPSPPGFAEHWHSGIFRGFKAEPDGLGHLRGLHIQAVWGPNCVPFEATAFFRSPTRDLSATMGTLRGKFVRAFADGASGYPITAIKSYPGITRQQRRSVVQTALNMRNRDFTYTFADMLDYNWWSWDGSIDDIDELRCDGLVEYCYEKNAMRVCNGEESSHWNVSHSGTDYPENHNNFHNNDYNQGEICPRIQAGDTGNDSNFETPPVETPQITSFSVSQPGEKGPVRIGFEVQAPQSFNVYCRLVVNKKGENRRYFLTTIEYPTPSEIPGDWILQEADANTANLAFWSGETALNGPNYSGNDGFYYFRLQVIDQGGNVSEEVCRWLNIHW